MRFKFLKTAVGVCLLFIVLLLSCVAANLTVNITASWPRGLYHSKKIVGSMDNYKNQLVLVCPDLDNPAIIKAVENNILPPSDGCESFGYAPLMKKIVGIPGDTITVTDQGITVNGRQLKNSKIKFKIFELLIHPGYTHILQPNEYWVMSDYNPNSLDSRYFGPISGQAIIQSSEPYLTIK